MNSFLYAAAEYKRHRPQYPLSLYEYLASLTPSRNTVVDCGTGNGQAATDLKKYFKKIIATDLSYDLLSAAPKLPDLMYVQAKAEYLPIQSQSIDMVCIAQALHWFSLNEFYKEVKRVLKPAGIIAAWCYNQCTVESEIDKLIHKIYTKITGIKNTSQERQYVYDHYQTIPFPFNKIITPYFELDVEWDLMQLYGYISTWPGLLEYEKKFNSRLLSQLENEFILAWGDVTVKKTIKWPINLLVGQ
ncbi:MAG: hypothetical protein A3F46_01345 [Legionellales bacterium RIFCSPHIGHO2_12_FULL_42_9]|nr:MAG: hypothetical protein A3F46_01345 [Legionellales bacterium RIFCSPHIGHO2_12_FULL_42_9]